MLSVRKKITIACQLNRVLRMARRLAGRDMRARATRRGIAWDLDLNEGIDLSIYLLGAYEWRALRSYSRQIVPGAVVFDIGANIGAHTLHFARLVGPAGKVHAFEPTDFAFAKLSTNLALNPSLARRVAPNRTFLVAHSGAALPAETCSSWPVNGANRQTLHWEHLGRSQSTEGAVACTADTYCAAAGISRLDFVKIDVDGHELAVLRGFEGNLGCFRPKILIEVAPFVHQAGIREGFGEFVAYLNRFDYNFVNASDGRPLPGTADSLREQILDGGSINVLLLPRT